MTGYGKAEYNAQGRKLRIEIKSLNKDQANATIKEYMYRVERFILLHYANGSIYDTKFWSYAKKMYDKNISKDMLEFLELSKNYKDEDGRNPDFIKDYAQWPTWSVKMWDDYVN